MSTKSLEIFSFPHLSPIVESSKEKSHVVFTVSYERWQRLGRHWSRFAKCVCFLEADALRAVQREFDVFAQVDRRRCLTRVSGATTNVNGTVLGFVDQLGPDDESAVGGFFSPISWVSSTRVCGRSRQFSEWCAQR